MNQTVRFPVGSFVIWKDEFYKITENKYDIVGEVVSYDGKMIKGFSFNPKEESPKRVTDVFKIAELHQLFSLGLL